MTEEIDWSRVEDAALALLYLSLHEGNCVWKQIDWAITDRLHERGFILDARNRSKSMALTAEGLDRAETMCKKMFIQDREHE